MPRYIDADAVKKFVFETGFYCDTDEDKQYTAEIIDSFPTADVVERKRGKWIDYPIADGCLQCSVCGILRFEEANYCPNCGADMRGEEE